MSDRSSHAQYEPGSARSQRSELRPLRRLEDTYALGGTSMRTASVLSGSPQELETDVGQVLSPLRRHALLMWVVLPLYVVVQTRQPMLQPTCESGISDFSVAVLVVLIAHHLLAESQAWEAAKALACNPELVVLRTLGVLRQRRWLVMLGLLEELSLFNDISFPGLAYNCRASMTAKWKDSWAEVPLVGSFVVDNLFKLRFWGASAICACTVLVFGFFSLLRLLTFKMKPGDDYMEVSHSASDRTYSSDMGLRMSGNAFVALAETAETAGSPSVARLCEELGLQRRWLFDPKEELGGTLGAAKVREDVVFGKLPARYLEEIELRDRSEQERVDSASSCHSCVTWIGKVLIGNVLQLWLQASYFDLAFANLGSEARIKLVIRIAISILHLLTRFRAMSFKMGILGLIFTLTGMMMAAWACAKVYFAFTLQGHSET